MQKMVILGATGSIGTNTLDVIARNPQQFSTYALVANTNVDKMLTLCQTHQPIIAHMVDSDAAKELAAQLPKNSATLVTTGAEQLKQLVTHEDVDTVMAAIVGAAGLVPTFDAVKAGKRILLANKEALVMSGQLFMDTARQSGATILPVDSEHNAIFQSMPQSVQSNLGFCDLNAAGIKHILLTGSGGPFLTSDLNALATMTPAQACNHPNWSMGPKISVDSATMMNKGLEYIEAKWLFNTNVDQLKVVIHPQSVIHSMVQYNDGSVIAELGNPDMRTPIAHCMSYPQRISSGVEPLDFFKLGQLNFCEPDFTRFPCLKLAIDACAQGQEATTVLNAANEVAVAAFLANEIAFTDIAVVNQQCLTQVSASALTSIEAILELDSRTRVAARQSIQSMINT
ncbi:1-deoxy-D-xylulose-5-phosphate reductoisomerase [Shewanella intestini]|uniref:1-deoxy-D-xylulose 5-phosphate reductoisomerase n=1 Tax=Shewanella intestini TaxID=2017544 RepID=A0ABS5HZE6_9GAMM|nr:MULTISPECIES: 1-deoxy-D-xylulose-5-phosphate reductoisomerase [Shewanella]MBR9726794.1 1-deoxy-D-xylulose-5-phosphate reductoisomerase [Shewanella intestini]MRG34640.1 1-deoxy-D-xylulose-5-phosphate reductoisomerase [Shewanella sp. XMDDZSB0408]